MRLSLRLVPARGQNRAIHFVAALVNNRPGSLVNNRSGLSWERVHGKAN